MYKVIANQSEEGLCAFISNEMGKLFCICRDPSDFWRFERAPEPKDIQWHNLGQNFVVRFVISTISSAAAIFVLFLGGVCVGLTKVQSKSIDQTNITTYYSLSFVCAMLITITNKITPYLIRQLAWLRGGRTIGEMNVSLTANLALLRFINTCVVPYVVLLNMKPYIHSAVAFDGFSTLLFVAFDPVISVTIDYVFDILKQRKLANNKSNIEGTKITQYAANEALKDAPIDAEMAVVQLVNLLASSFFYATVCPIALPLGAFGVLIHYMILKYQTTKWKGMPGPLVSTVPMYWVNTMTAYAIGLLFGFSFMFNETNGMVPIDTSVKIGGTASAPITTELEYIEKMSLNYLQDFEVFRFNLTEEQYFSLDRVLEIL